MKQEIEHYLPFPLLLWRAATQPFWTAIAWLTDLPLVDLLIRIKLRLLEDVKS